MMDANQQTSIESKLQWAWRQERRFINIRGAFRVLIWFIGLLAIGFIIDWGLFAKAGLRANLGIVLLVINVAILAWAVWHEWVRHLKPFDAVHVSLAVERRHSGLNSLLVSYAQLDPSNTDKTTVSTELIGAMRDEAVMQARPLDFREIVDFGQIKKLILVGVGVFLLFSVLSFIWSDHVGVFFKRLAGSDVRYPTQTQLKSVSGDLTVRVGDIAIINAKAGGALPPEGRLFTRAAGGKVSWKELPMKSDEDPASFSREVKGLVSDLRYYVRVGDDRSEEYFIRVITAPQVVATKVTIEYPGYMNKAATVSDQLNLEVPEGTKVRWNLTCEPPVKRCEVSIGERAFDAKLDASGTKLEFEHTAKEAFKYTFRWTEREKEFKYDDVQYGVRVVPDGIPEVELLRPTANGLATVDKTLKITARASDDHGLAKAWLLYSINAGKEERIEIKDFQGAPGQEFTHEWKLKKTIPDLKPPAQIAIAIEVDDLHPDKANRKRRSSTRVLTIVELEAYKEWFRAELAAQAEELKRSRDSEMASSTQVKAIKNQESDPKQK
ncbi:MAG: hypothetical protein EXS27_00075 [Pedosphaera sp.]|nr:hypothetical protein [Pedosphaera sp.]